MSIRRRLRSAVHRITMGTLNIALEGLEDLENTVEGWFEDPPVDDDEDLALDPYADELDDDLEDDLDDEEFIEETEAYLDAVDEIEGDIAQLEMELDVELGEAGTVLPFPRVSTTRPMRGEPKMAVQLGVKQDPKGMGTGFHPVPFLDAETNSPILQLRGKKNKFGETRRVVISNDKIPAWAKLKVVGLQVTVHGWQSEEELKSVPEGKERIFIFNEDELGHGEEGLESNVEIVLVDKGCSRATVAKILAEAFEMEVGDITDRLVKLALHGPPKSDLVPHVPLFAKSLRVDDGGNLLGQKGWNPLTLSMDEPMGLREYPLLEHLEDEDSRVTMKVALGPLGEKRTEALICSISLLVSIEADSVMDVAGGLTGR